MKKGTEKEHYSDALTEIKMWRRKYIDDMLFTDSNEEKWFAEMLMSREPGMLNPDEYADFMLKGYRKTKRENS